MGRATTTLRMSSAFLVLFLSGCASATVDTGGIKAWAPPVTSAPAATAQDVAASRASGQAAGTTVVTDAKSGLSVTLPAGYVRITSKAQLASLVKAGSASSGAKLEAASAQYGSLVDSARIFAIKAGATDSAANLNILVVPAAGVDAAHVADFYDQVQPTLEGQLGATIISHKVETVAGTRALRIEYRLPVGTKSVRGTQVYLVHKDSVLVTTVTQNDAKGSEAEVNLIVDSLRLG